LAVEQPTFDDSNPENLAGESDIEVYDPEFLPTEPGQLDGTVVSDVVPALEDRWAPLVTVKDAERVFHRTKSSLNDHCEEAVNYQRQ
jgi:hypothetical protein